MKFILRVALAAFLRLDLATLNRLWAAVGRLVPALEVAKRDGIPMTGQQKIEYVVKMLRAMVPATHARIEPQIIRLIVEIVLIEVRRRNGGTLPRQPALTRRGGHVFGVSVSPRHPVPHTS